MPRFTLNLSIEALENLKKAQTLLQTKLGGAKITQGLAISYALKSLVEQEENIQLEEVMNMEELPKKKIIIFSAATNLGAPFTGHTVHIATKMNKFAKKNNINAKTDINVIANIDSIGKEADIILLTPDLYAREAEVKAKFPDKPVKVINKEAYGFFNPEIILYEAMS